MDNTFRVHGPHGLLLALPLAALALALYLALGWDADVAAWHKAWRHGHPGAVFGLHLLTDWTNALFYLLYAGLFLHGYRTSNRALMRLALLYAVFQLVVAFGAVRVLKIGLGRPRPDVGGCFVFFSLDSAHNSLPSGHTAEIVGAVLPLALWLRRSSLSLALGLLIALMAYSRVALGWHFVSDTLAGGAMGALSGLAIYFFWAAGEPEGCLLAPLYRLLPNASSPPLARCAQPRNVVRRTHDPGPR